jgi:threonine synthase
MAALQYCCPDCGRAYAVDRPRWRCDCGGPLDLTPGPGLARGDIDGVEKSLWRYRAALGLRPPTVSLGEGWTPLVMRDWQGAPVHFKLESQMPTGSFKDRGTAVMIAHLTEVGVGRIHEDSSGNAGASIAAWAALYGLGCRIYVPATAPRAKLVQIAATGVELRRVAGSRQDVTLAALAAAEGDSFYASHNWQPFFIEGTQTLAFELWEQLGFRAPDNVLVPTGYGSNILGLERGFDALLRRGEATRLPRLFAVQAANCAALAAAWAAGADGFVPFAAGATVADGIATPRPVRPAQVLRALRRSQGGVVAVEEAAIAPALQALGRLGLFVEPTAATAGAALSQLLHDGRVRRGETTVAVLTGHGLKAADRIGDLLGIAAG